MGAGRMEACRLAETAGAVVIYSESLMWIGGRKPSCGTPPSPYQILKRQAVPAVPGVQPDSVPVSRYTGIVQVRRESVAGVSRLPPSLLRCTTPSRPNSTASPCGSFRERRSKVSGVPSVPDARSPVR